MKRPTLEQISLVTGAAYLVLLTVPVSIGGRAFLHDALVPVMGILALLSGSSLKERLRRHWLLALFLLVGLFATIAHAFGAPGDLYEWMVFAIMAVIWSFFLEIPLSPAWSGRLALGLFGLTTAAFIWELLPLPSLFSFTSPQMETTAMPFLARRFAFTLGNPNLFALYLAIPAALLARYARSRDWSAVPLSRRLLAFPALCVIMLPVLSSCSKHGLLPLALLLGCFPALFPACKLRWRVAVSAAILLLAAVFETTVLWTVFPVGPHGINRSPGMYRLHQSTYCRMLSDNPSALLSGAGESRVHALYPRYSEPDTVSETLQRYNAMASYRDFITFMDPHCEYLNLTVLFGLPAMLLMVVFWCSRPCSLDCGNRFSAALFVLALLACCLWDDLLSKRAVWMAAAILFNKTGGSRQ